MFGKESIVFLKVMLIYINCLRGFVEKLGRRESQVARIVGLFVGLAVFLLLLLLPVPGTLGATGWKVIACAALMVIWWVTEAIPIPVTALLPILLLPLLDIADVKQAAAPYGNPLVFLFLGGFMIAIAMERWKLHIRIALTIVKMVGTHPNGIIGGFMIATAFLSMWMSNTATTVMMLPIAISMIDLLKADESAKEYSASEYRKFFTALMLSTAYAANIGGTATLIGTPPNLIFSAFLQSNYGIEIGFFEWAMVGVPFAVSMLFLAWLVLTKVFYRTKLTHLHSTREVVVRKLHDLGAMSRGEKLVATVFVMTAFLWIFRPILQKFSGLDISDSAIAIFGAIMLFVLPVDLKKGQFVMHWSDTDRLPWGILLLFGGGLSLASALGGSGELGDIGVIQWVGGMISGLENLHSLGLIAVVVLVVLLMTELMSNMALTAIFLPVAAALALGIGENPLITTIPITLAASCAFMLPIATPPNAIVFASGYVSIAHMARTGIVLNAISVIMVTLFAYSVIYHAFGIEPGVIPEWAKE